MRGAGRQEPLLLQAAMVLACGVLLTLSLPPAGFWPAALALVPLLVLVARSAGFRRAFALGFWFGIGFFSLYLLWLPASLSQPDWFGPFFWALYPPLVAILGCFWGLACGLCRLVGGEGRGTLLLLPVAWTVTELLRNVGYFAFPWGTLGYMWLDTPLAQLADLVGVNGLSLLTLTIVALLSAPFVPPLSRPRHDRVWLAPVFGAVLLLAAWLSGAQRFVEPGPTTHTALLVQPDLDPFGRLASPRAELLVQTNLTADGSSGQSPDLVVWPEGSLLGFDLNSPASSQLLADIQQSSPGSAFVVGGRGVSERGSHNRAWLLQDSRFTGSYDKSVLVPFGETWPLMDSLSGFYRFVFGLLQVGMLQDTAPGLERPALQVAAAADWQVGVYICYESVFPQVTADLVGNGAGVLVNITNDAWFARGNGARQHFDMGRMRAIETRRYILRAGLDGITGVVDPNGRGVAELPRDTPGTMLAHYSVSEERTVFVQHGSLLWLLLAVWAVAGAGGRFLIHGLPE